MKLINHESLQNANNILIINNTLDIQNDKIEKAAYIVCTAHNCNSFDFILLLY